jgi:Ca2+-binding RTX toxin-like protein
MSDLIDIAGAGWFSAANLMRRFASLGSSLTIEEAKSFVLDSFGIVASLNDEELEIFMELEEAVKNGGITLFDIDKIVLEELLAASGDKGTYDLIQGTPSISAVYGTALNNVIYGSADISNNIMGLAGNDIIVGLRGDDVIEGGSGSNYFVWYVGDGNDTIVINASVNDFNVLCFAEDVDYNDISFEMSGDDLLIYHTPTDDVAETITISDWFVSPANQLSQIKFIGDVVEWSNVEINEMIEESFVGGLG